MFLPWHEISKDCEYFEEIFNGDFSRIFVRRWTFVFYSSFLATTTTKQFSKFNYQWRSLNHLKLNSKPNVGHFLLHLLLRDILWVAFNNFFFTQIGNVVIRMHNTWNNRQENWFCLFNIHFHYFKN